MIKNNYRFALCLQCVTGVLAVVLFGGAGVTVSAAQAALPGDSTIPRQDRMGVKHRSAWPPKRI